ncbi:bifunctional diguanylate cyclase/phosphodiesterase [Variovorax sp. H27-G14]|uniref:putative bifunctional diguanylate cyclase/phosphodiesterase n=1 Tax=Variovorax sp. H27-G14 TaxID=3111914 RepID=UPI0038FCCBD0
MAGTALSGGIALWVLLGYAINAPGMWRPVSDLPPTHPYTALCLLILSVALLPGKSTGLPRAVARVAVVVALCLVAIRLLVPLTGNTLFSALTPFAGTLESQRQATGKGIAMPLNVALTLLLLCLGDIARRMRYWLVSQLLATAALAMLFVAFTGYLGGLLIFKGAMAPFTVAGITSLALALLLATSRRSFMRALTARSEPGRLARRLLGSTTLILAVGVWLVAKRLHNPGMQLPSDGVLLIYQSAFIIGLIWVVVTIGTVRADGVDRLRGIAERLTQRAADRDALTGLLTRNKMMHMRRSATPAAVSCASELLIDLDGFRAVNEAFGTEEGDRVLVEVATRLRSVASGHPVGRIGGDEFAIYCADLTADEAEELGHAVRQALARPYAVRGRSFRLAASVGTAHAKETDGANLAQAADQAMYVAKARGGNQAVTFENAMHDLRKQEVELEQDLHQALINDGELWLAFQPVVRVADRQIVAVESLARWRHPRLGAIPPDRFILLAERKGLIAALGRKLLGLAVDQAAAWEQASPGQWPVINLNVSPAQFAAGDVVAELLALLAQQGLPPARFCIEVTEGVFADGNAVAALERARRHGFKVAMDDFGVGYSTLSQLPRMPLTSLKLDRSFIVNAGESEGDAAVFSSIVQLAHALKLLVVAEGVETQAQFDLAASCDCDAIQGYFIARPMAPADFDRWTRDALERPSSSTAAASSAAAPSCA